MNIYHQYKKPLHMQLHPMNTCHPFNNIVLQLQSNNTPLQLQFNNMLPQLQFNNTLPQFKAMNLNQLMN